MASSGGLRVAGGLVLTFFVMMLTAEPCEEREQRVYFLFCRPGYDDRHVRGHVSSVILVPPGRTGGAMVVVVLSSKGGPCLTSSIVSGAGRCLWAPGASYRANGVIKKIQDILGAGAADLSLLNTAPSCPWEVKLWSKVLHWLLELLCRLLMGSGIVAFLFSFVGRDTLLRVKLEPSSVACVKAPCFGSFGHTISTTFRVCFLYILHSCDSCV